MLFGLFKTRATSGSHSRAAIMSRPHPLALTVYQRRTAEACAKIAGLEYAINSLTTENAEEWVPHVLALRTAEANVGAAMLALSSAWERDARAGRVSYEDALARVAGELDRLGVIRRGWHPNG
jgi:nickel-dependent lactate racemase